MTDFESTTLIRLRLEEEIHSTGKLQESQKELKEFLLRNSDPEFEQAYVENKEVLERKLTCINELHDKLMTIDPAYRQEKSRRADLVSLMDTMNLSNSNSLEAQPVRVDDVARNETIQASTVATEGDESRNDYNDHHRGIYL